MSISVGQRIGILRVLNGYTQEELTPFTGLNRSSLSCWERDEYGPSVQKAKILAGALGCSPAYLIFGSPRVDGAVWTPRIPEGKHVHLFREAMTDILPLFLAENGFDRCAVLVEERLVALYRGTSAEGFVALEEPIFDLVVELIKSCLAMVEAADLDADNIKRRVDQVLKKREYARAKAALEEIEVKYWEAKKYLDSFGDMGVFSGQAQGLE